MVELKNSKSMFLRYFAKQGLTLFKENQVNGIYEFYGKNWFGDYGKSVKKRLRPLSMIRKSMVPNKEWDDPVSSLVLENHFPHGTSSKVLCHLGDMIIHGTGDGKGLSFFNWGNEEHHKMLYGSENPPIIDIFSNPVPMVIFAGINDKIVNIDDVRTVTSKMENIKNYTEIEGDHLSFFIGKDMSYVDTMIEQIKSNI